MPPKLALLLGFIFVAFVFWRDAKRAPSASALWIPIIWYLVAASRPFGNWLYIWGIPIGGGGGDATEGSSIERFYFLTLMFLGLVVLSRRPVEWRTVVRENRWLLFLLCFMLISVSWSAYGEVSIKRFVKLVGSVVMALVILTERDPLAALFTVLRRSFYVHLPMSIIFVKYFRNLGVNFDWFGTGESWQGISMSKNTLGQVAMVAGIYFLWDVMSHWRERGWKQWSLVFLGMALYLLKGSDDSFSLTAVAVFLFALVVFLCLGQLRESPWRQRAFLNLVGASTSVLLFIVIVHSVVMFSEDSLFGKIITSFGRDITLTSRTVIWNEIYEVVAGRELIGVGFGAFWIGELANIPFSQQMTWTLGQAHSGYVDTYLQLGWIGVFLFLGLLVSSYRRLLNVVAVDFERGRFLITLLLTTIFVNITESTFLRGDHPLWLLFLVSAVRVPTVSSLASATEPLQTNEPIWEPEFPWGRNP